MLLFVVTAGAKYMFDRTQASSVLVNWHGLCLLPFVSAYNGPRPVNGLERYIMEIVVEDVWLTDSASEATKRSKPS